MKVTLSTINYNILKQTFKGEQNNSKSASPLKKSLANDSFEMSIGYINDTHGQTNNMMRILSGLSGDLKLSAGDNDIGDEKNKPIHRATAKFLNIADIKASALGNHEMDTTQADLMETAVSQYSIPGHSSNRAFMPAADFGAQLPFSIRATFRFRKAEYFRWLMKSFMHGKMSL